MTAPNPQPAPRRGRLPTTAPDLTPIDPDSPEPVERQVYRSLRRALMQGAIAPGGTMTSRSLAQALGISTQPVRDALKRLEADGVLTGRPQSGFHLRQIGQAEFTELTEMRLRLEGLAGRLAAGRIRPARVASLRTLNAQLPDQPDTAARLLLNYRFHYAIYLCAARPNLLTQIRNLWVRAGPALNHHPYTGDPATIVQFHAGMLDALEAGDGAATEAAIARDITSAAEVIRAQLPARGDAPHVPGVPPARDGLDHAIFG